MNVTKEIADIFRKQPIARLFDIMESDYRDKWDWHSHALATIGLSEDGSPVTQEQIDANINLFASSFMLYLAYSKGVQFPPSDQPTIDCGRYPARLHASNSVKFSAVINPQIAVAKTYGIGIEDNPQWKNAKRQVEFLTPDYPGIRLEIVADRGPTSLMVHTRYDVIRGPAYYIRNLS